MSNGIWGPGEWRDLTRIDEGDLVVGGRSLTSPRDYASAAVEATGFIRRGQAGRVRDVMQGRRRRGSSDGHEV